MAIIDAYEVTILTSDNIAANDAQKTKISWKPVAEYVAMEEEQSMTPNKCTRHITAYSIVDPLFGHLVPQQFAIDLRITGGFAFADDDSTELLVFRIYHDGRKIGSGYVPREKWERPGTFRVRKKGRRFWLEAQQWWVMERWSFDDGLHGTIKVVVWRERYDYAQAGTWNNPELPDGMEDIELSFYLNSNALDFNPGPTRVRHARKIDAKPLATFLFEYRSQGLSTCLFRWVC